MLLLASLVLEETQKGAEVGRGGGRGEKMKKGRN